MRILILLLSSKFSCTCIHIGHFLAKKLIMNNIMRMRIFGRSLIMGTLHPYYRALHDSPPDRSNWGLTNQRRELFRHTNTHLSLVNSKLNVCNHCLATYKAQ